MLRRKQAVYDSLRMRTISRRIATLVSSKGVPVREFFLSAALLEKEVESIAGTNIGDGLALYEQFISAVISGWQRLRVREEADQLLHRLTVRWTAALRATGTPPPAIALRIAGWVDGDDAISLFSRFAGGIDDAVAVDLEILLTSRARGMRRAGGTQWRELLRAFYFSRGALEPLIALVGKGEASVGDCAAIAELLLKNGRAREALGWVERGMTSAVVDDHDAFGRMPALKGEALRQSGSEEEALDAAWEEYVADISHPRFLTLLSCASEHKRETWRQHALTEAEKQLGNGGLSVLVAEGHFRRLMALADKLDEVHFEPSDHPNLAAVASTLSLGEPALAAKYFHAAAATCLARGAAYEEAAVALLRSVRVCSFKGKTRSYWNDCVADVRDRFSDRRRFMRRFEQMVRNPRG